MKNLINATTPIVKNESFELRKIYANGRNFITFTFHGKLTDTAAEEACRSWCKLVNSSPSTSFTHVWDCENMSGFDQSAKNAWMECMNKTYDQTDEIWLVANNILIRGAARLMSKFGRHELLAFKNYEEVDNYLKTQKEIVFA